MKKKNIFSSASLKVWLVVIAIIPAFIAVRGVNHTKVDPTPSGSVADNLEPITSLSISYEDFKGGKIEGKTYYDNKSWYNYAERSVNSSNTSMDWKIGQAIAFKLDEGDYILSVDYTCSNDDRGLWVYAGDAYLATYNKEVGISEKGSFSGIKEIPLAGGKIWWVSGINDTFKLRSISIKKEGATTEPESLSKVFPSDIDAINSNTFWYHNGGDGIGYVGSYGSFYRYFVNKSGNYYAPTSTNMISINGVKNFKSYELKQGEAVGFKLAPYNNNDEYRIKLYYYSEGATAVLRTGINVSTAFVPPSPNEWGTSLESTTIVRDAGGTDTKTCIDTYHVRPNENTVYWVKNETEGKSLYLGGFEILRKNEGWPTGEFTGSWYVEDAAAGFINSIDDKNTVVGSIAQSHDGVVMGSVTMPINNYEVIEGKKSVMINWGSNIGVNIPSGAT
ncbi:MAG: hypothetical protein K2K25_01640, partial [Muribaculaceae bacterium]|nr:hypothetical protein [Muribaculaceae bacterium]